MNGTDLGLVGDRERQAYYMPSDREYAHTREYSPELLKKIGIDVEFRAIWKVVGWQRFVVFANFNNIMQQQHDDLQAYFRFQGFNPYQGP
uniref:Uncharacterized protein n=1 Tax=Oryza sativa subsp. japonica TaxID=39947 RepID=Q6Z4W2_ORYSJ|nr:hypothetical protein [Oryza sativa Japonica Group]BAC99736.1 hypothetical protein [Oryza sativa Japonica Group]